MKTKDDINIFQNILKEWKGIFGVLFLILFLGWFPVDYLICHNRENLRRDYEEVFATPFENVSVVDYVNEKAGHGTRFFMVVKSNAPLNLKTPDKFRELDVHSDEASWIGIKQFAKEHSDWSQVCLYNDQIKPGPIWVHFNQPKDMAAVRAETLSKSATIK